MKLRVHKLSIRLVRDSSFRQSGSARCRLPRPATVTEAIFIREENERTTSAHCDTAKMILELLIGLACLAAYKVWRLKQKWGYWRKLGVRTPPDNFPVGNSPLADKRKHVMHVARDQYRMFEGESFYGTYMMGAPQLMITDPELMKTVMVKDFNHFVNRNSPKFLDMIFGGTAFTDELWRKQMTSLFGDEWKQARATFSPIFTSGKMKAMMPFVQAVTGQLMKALEQEVDREVDLKDYFGRFSMESLASCAFGVELGAFNDPDSEFIKHAKNIFTISGRDSLRIILGALPVTGHLLRLFKVANYKPTEAEFFYKIIRRTLEHRQVTHTKRNDLIDMMIEALKGGLDAEDEATADQDQFDVDAKLTGVEKKKEVDEIIIIATALVFLVVGYDTTAQTLTYVGYELAKHPEVQRRLQEEIDLALEESASAKGATAVPYYTLTQGMEYLDQVIHEALRLYPALAVITRGCSEDYVLQTPGHGNGTLKLEKGTEVHLNVAGMHMDPKHYANPEKFDPDHFSKENKAKRHPYAYLGFGSGPRSCIGMRFALLEAKAALVAILAKYSFVKSESTPEVIELDPRAGLATPKVPVYVRVVKR